MFAIVGDGAGEIALVEVDEPALPEGAACYVTVTELDGAGRADRRRRDRRSTSH